MYTAKITKTKAERHQATNTAFIEVEFDILGERPATEADLLPDTGLTEEGAREGEMIKRPVVTKKIGLDPETSPEGVQAEVQKALDGYVRDLEQAERQKAQDALDANATAIAGLEGKELSEAHTDEK